MKLSNELDLHKYYRRDIHFDTASTLTAVYTGTCKIDVHFIIVLHCEHCFVALLDLHITAEVTK
jgi:hypothetical protein